MSRPPSRSRRDRRTFWRRLEALESHHEPIGELVTPEYRERWCREAGVDPRSAILGGPNGVYLPPEDDEA